MNIVIVDLILWVIMGLISFKLGQISQKIRNNTKIAKAMNKTVELTKQYHIDAEQYKKEPLKEENSDDALKLLEKGYMLQGRYDVIGELLEMENDYGQRGEEADDADSETDTGEQSVD